MRGCFIPAHFRERRERASSQTTSQDRPNPIKQWNTALTGLAENAAIRMATKLIDE